MARTAEQAKQALRRDGVTIKAWAKQRCFPVTCVRAVLTGHNKGHYGQAHEIAVALGIKEQPK